jgi:NAD(P)-dependent dehydrogenase (short-subunit alcohol dehydrogenase family)
MGVKNHTVTIEGLGSQFGANYIGHFLLTNLLMPKIEAAGKGARIVNLTSNGHQLSDVRFNGYNFDYGKNYDPWAEYGQSKTANMLFTVSLASKLASKGMFSYSVHPGGVGTNPSNDVGINEWPKVAEMFEGRGFAESAEFIRGFLRGEAGSGFKFLAIGTSTTLVAALDASIESMCIPNKMFSDANLTHRSIEILLVRLCSCGNPGVRTQFGAGTTPISFK